MRLVKLRDIFHVKYGVNLELNSLVHDETGVNFVSRTTRNNGISAKVERLPDIEPLPAGLITVAGGGSVLATFLQPEPFYSGRDLYCLTPKVEMSEAIKLYYCACIRSNRYRYSYGRQANRTLKDIKVPVMEEIPAWVHQADVSKFEHAYLPAKASKKPISLNIEDWQYFKFKDIFSIKKGKRLTKEDQIAGDIFYISSSSNNNGVDNLISNGFTDENCLSFACYGSIGEVFYQENKCWISDNCNAIYLKNKNLNKYISLFLITIMKLDQYRFSYGMTAKKGRLEKFSIKLPTKNNQPDFEFMENYIKSLPYSSSI